MKRKNVLFLLLLLSITPFSRGCSYTHGFPLPASCLQINPGQTKIADILNCLQSSPWQIAIIIINILTACLLACLIIRKFRNIKWLPSFFAALWVNLLLIWSYFFIYIANLPESKQGIAVKISEIYVRFCSSYIIWKVPHFLYKKIAVVFPQKSAENIILDFTTRAWLITASLLLGALLYKIKNARNKPTSP